MLIRWKGRRRGFAYETNRGKKEKDGFLPYLKLDIGKVSSLEAMWGLLSDSLRRAMSKSQQRKGIFWWWDCSL